MLLWASDTFCKTAVCCLPVSVGDWGVVARWWCLCREGYGTKCWPIAGVWGDVFAVGPFFFGIDGVWNSLLVT